jgi:ADP-ribosylglycohydrolase
MEQRRLHTKSGKTFRNNKLTDHKQLTLKSLAGLSLGDAFGEQFFGLRHLEHIQRRQLPAGIWNWTDDTHMALSIVDVLFTYGRIEQDALAQLFAQRFMEEPWRGYGGGAIKLLTLYARGANWRTEAPQLFNGGSYGNGGAMRAAPIGAFFATDPEQAAHQARLSAQVTHAHIEGQAGAMAVAVATAIKAAQGTLTGTDFLQKVLTFVPPSQTQEQIREAVAIAPDEQQKAIDILGTGQQVAAFDTVPYCLWIVAHHAVDFEDALWKTVAGLGDRDTTCAIVSGIVAVSMDIPADWLEHREPLPQGFEL